MNDQHTTEDEAAVASFHDDPLEVVRVIAGLAAQYKSMSEDERRGQPSPVRPDSPMAQAAVRICLLNGYAEDGNELPGFMERAALRELEANPTRELRALQEAMRPAPGPLTPERIDAIMANSFPHTKPTTAYRKFALDIAATVLEDAATACETKYAGIGGVPDDPNPDAVIHNSAVNECVTSIRALKGAAS